MRKKVRDAEKVLNDAEANYNALLVQFEKYWDAAVLQADIEQRMMELVDSLEEEAVHRGCELVTKAEEHGTLTEAYQHLQDRFFVTFLGLSLFLLFLLALSISTFVPGKHSLDLIVICLMSGTWFALNNCFAELFPYLKRRGITPYVWALA